VLYPAWADASSVTPRGRRERVMAVARLRLHLAAGPLQFSGRSGLGWMAYRPEEIPWLMSPAFLENTKNAHLARRHLVLTVEKSLGS
jgi:hypothetical protein